LLEIDDSTNAEFPKGFKSQQAQECFFILITKLNMQFSSQLSIESGKLIQDSSFHAQATLPKEWLLDHEYTVQLRASKFGNLIAIIDDDQVLKNEILEVIKRYVEEGNYQFVPSQVLWERYSGKHKGINGFNNWMHRYFDWI
jgi:hypothetical protein